MTKNLCILVFALAFFSCNQRKDAEANTDLLYFDVKGYFKNEALHLQKVKPLVQKLVNLNGDAESKATKINDWEKELTIFTDADINKTSWRGSFKINKVADTETYTSDNRKIPVKRIIIVKVNGKVTSIEIIRENKNMVYQSTDTLLYYPDSLYEIRKQQKIKLLNPKKYIITGKLK
ncbi:hypothetical protein [Pedobacter punctiformis]|uniref:Uncharacterized protein n=1 Tax=Pedobacter punctiformis TaxID=3004097 RepID=A0ABT4LA25_9SPHI|nr:hypothetical protein [Pedobacter sp. HCMS5-2]MCZ4244761.1 hypothetical protein [Pedobacter sp. HCMS5-2]